MPITDPARHRFHELDVRNAVEVPAQVSVNHLSMPGVEQRHNLPDGIQGTSSGSVRVLLGRQVGLEDRLQDQHRRRLHHAVLDGRNAQRTLLSVGLGDPDPTDSLGMISLFPEFFRQFAQPAFASVRLDVHEILPVHSWRAVVSTTAGVGKGQHVRAVHLVVQQVETIVGRPLRFRVQRLLQLPNLRWSFQAHANLPALGRFGRCP